MDERSFQILIMNLLNRAVDIQIAKGGEFYLDDIESTLEDLKGLVRKQITTFRENNTQ